MSGTDEIRALLEEATALRGEVRVRPSAAGAVRARARRRRLVVAASAAAVLVVSLLGALVVPLVLDPGPDRLIFTPSGPATLAPDGLPLVAEGPVWLAAPIELRPVLAEHPTCPDGDGTVPAAEGPSCYRLGPADLVLRRLADLEVSPASAADGTPATDRGDLLLTMTTADADAFARLTAERVEQRIAVVVDGRVLSAPVIAGPIDVGKLGLSVSRAVLRDALDDLGVTTS